MLKLPVTVTVLQKRESLLPLELGTIVFTKVPVAQAGDYTCRWDDGRNAKKLVTLDEAKHIASELQQNKVVGEFDDKMWQV
jgi:hypothetical protein